MFPDLVIYQEVRQFRNCLGDKKSCPWFWRIIQGIWKILIFGHLDIFGYFSISFEKNSFDTEILTWKVVLWIFSTHEKTSQKNFFNIVFSVENSNFYTGQKKLFLVFFHKSNEWKNTQSNFSHLIIECNIFKWDGKVTKTSHQFGKTKAFWKKKSLFLF